MNKSLLDLVSQIPNYDPFVGDIHQYKFDEEKAQRAVDFIEEVCVHTKGRWAGKPLILEDWQRAIVANLFGWVHKGTGLRRYRECLVYVPRKNGKSLLIAAIALYSLLCDGELGAEIYCAAAEREQASLVWNMCRSMINLNPVLGEHTRVYSGNTARSIVCTDGAGDSFIKPVSSDAETKHGFNTHLALIDEIHAHKNSDLYDVLETSTVSRSQPLIICMTTADFARPSLCNEKLKYAKGVIGGSISDVQFLPVIYEVTLKDDWTDPSVWARANPNYGISVPEEYMRRKCQKALDEPSYENTFKRLHLNIVTESSEKFFDLNKWDICGQPPVDLNDLKGAKCYGGLDLSSTIDLSSFSLYFPDYEAIFVWFWAPSDNAHMRERRDKVPYLLWARQGFIELTPGNVIDYKYIRKKINAILPDVDLVEIGYDPFNARQFAIQLQDEDGIPMVEFRQGFISMNEPTKKLEMLVLSETIRHQGSEILRWQAGNAVVKSDPAGNIKLDKNKSVDKIDGIIASIMAIGCAMGENNSGNCTSVYEERGALIF